MSALKSSGESTKDKDKMEDQGAQDWALIWGKEVMKEEYFLHTRKPPHRWGQWGASEPQRGAQ